jgi:2-hydroxy-3-keto-5-methylthiopentenyl-1-phosphate phosphatase
MQRASWNLLDDLPRGELAMLCDFDGTITSIDTVGFLFRKFAAAGLEYARQMVRGEMDMREELRATFRTVSASKEEMEAALNRVEIDPGFVDFLEFGRAKGYTFAILSDGLDWYIKYILGRYGIDDIDIFANRIFFEEDGFRFEFPWFDEETHRRGVCKPKIARVYRERFNTLVFAGDGISDIDVIHEVDHVFTRGWLAGYCYAKGINNRGFFDWYDLKEKWIEEKL